MQILRAREISEEPSSPRRFRKASVRRIRREIIYPDSDGKPMSDNTKQFEWIVKIKENLEQMFADTPDVFVAGDLLWYPVKGNNKIRIAPDAMVAFGRPKGYRGSYKMWEENNTVPQVVFEILSPCNTSKEMDDKLGFYEKYGVSEYYEYDPDRVILKGWIRRDNTLYKIENMRGWVSPLLKIRFELGNDDLHIFRPDGRKFLSSVEAERLYRKKILEEQQKAESARKKVLLAEKKAASARKKALSAEKKAEQEYLRAESERLRAEHLAAKLRELGVEIADFH